MRELYIARSPLTSLILKLQKGVDIVDVSYTELEHCSIYQEPFIGEGLVVVTSQTMVCCYIGDAECQHPDKVHISCEIKPSQTFLNLAYCTSSITTALNVLAFSLR